MFYIKLKTSHPNSMIIINRQSYNNYWKCLEEFNIMRKDLRSNDIYDNWFSIYQYDNAGETYFISTDNTEQRNLLFDD